MSSTSPDSTDFLNILDQIAKEDAAGLKKAQLSYGNSWKKRGGIGAFMMLARKWDRIEKQLTAGMEPGDLENVKTMIEEMENDRSTGDQIVRLHSSPGNYAKILKRIIASCFSFDIFHAIETDTRPEGIIDDVRDLRRYLMLIEAEARALGLESALSTHRDND